MSFFRKGQIFVEKGLEKVEVTTVLPAAMTGFVTMNVLTHPRSRVWHKLKAKNYKTQKVQVFPSLRYFKEDKVIHLHHWFNFGLLLVISIFVTNNFLDSNITRGFLLGGVLQGLSYGDGNARKLIYQKHRDTYFKS